MVWSGDPLTSCPRHFLQTAIYDYTLAPLSKAYQSVSLEPQSHLGQAFIT